MSNKPGIGRKYNDIKDYGTHLAILTSKGAEILIDYCDRAFAINYRWEISKGYAKTTVNKKHLRLHTLLLPKRVGLEPDHISRDKLDNRRSNLRYVTHQENCLNRKVSGKVKYRYIYEPTPGYYHLQRTVNGQVEYGGSSRDLSTLLPLQQQWDNERILKLSNSLGIP